MMRLHILGVNGPFPESHGATSGYLLEADDCFFGFDLGCGVLSALTALTAPENLTALLFTHWHFDHCSDLGVLLYRLEACGKTLSVYGPEDPASAMFRLADYASCVDLHPVSPGHMLSLGSTDIHVHAARHPVPAVGYTAVQDGKVFGYTGDTNTLPSLSEDYRSCDLLLADGLFPAAAWSPEKPHLSAELAARLAVEADARSLVLTHFNPLFSRDVLLAEARAVYPAVRLASPGDSILL